MSAIIHVVQIAFRPEANGDEVNRALEMLGNLQQSCVKAHSGQRYITSSQWGSDISPEGAQNGYTHMFLFEFSSAQDRDYYLKEDPAHIAAANALTPLVEKVQVLDIEKDSQAERQRNNSCL